MFCSGVANQAESDGKSPLSKNVREFDRLRYESSGLALAFAAALPHA